MFAPAKLTLSLRVTGVRADGFHLLDAEMVSLDLFDELTFADGTNTLPAGDLVSKALRAVGRDAHVTLTKRIPSGAGLGGGSSDAAAVLRWAGCESVDVAVGLGADVPFCLAGGGYARVRGIGEIVEPLPFDRIADRVWTLLTPPLHVSTPAVYAAWDALGGPVGERGNDLEPAALVVEPALASWRDRLGDATGVEPRLAGSGSTWFVDGAFPDCLPGAVVAHPVIPWTDL